MTKILDSSISKDSLSTLGDRLFGRALRLRVAAWILSEAEESFFQGQVAAGVNYTASAVADELERLVELRMIVRHDKLAGDRRLYYSKTASPLWDIIGHAIRTETLRAVP
jgi:DNA-binding MarR family transcriptional regulator